MESLILNVNKLIWKRKNLESRFRDREHILGCSGELGKPALVTKGRVDIMSLLGFPLL